MDIWRREFSRSFFKRLSNLDLINLILLAPLSGHALGTGNARATSAILEMQGYSTGVF